MSGGASVGFTVVPSGSTPSLKFMPYYISRSLQVFRVSTLLVFQKPNSWGSNRPQRLMLLSHQGTMMAIV